VKALISFREQEIFLAGLWAATGFTQKPVSFRKLDHSPSTYSLRKKLSILVNSITSFSNKPLISIFYLGTIMTLFSFIFVLYMIYRKVMWGIDIEGWLTLVVSIWLIGGVTIFSIGIVGIYLSKIFVESKRRPYTIVRRQYGKYEGPTQKH
jgi:putative glycosyltransferase